MKSYYIRGAIGDLIYSLPTIKALGGGIIYNGLPIEQHKALEPLIKPQSYVKQFNHESKDGLPAGFINLEDFVHLQKNPNHLCESFAKVMDIKVNYKDGWLTLPSQASFKRSYAIINVTQRYRDKVFSWGKELRFLIENTDDGICFLGHYDEYKIFSKQYSKYRIRWVKTDNLLEAALLIQNAKYFSGTQSSLLAIAEGIGRTYRFERSPFLDNCRLGVQRETVINERWKTYKIHHTISLLQEIKRNLLR